MVGVTRKWSDLRWFKPKICGLIWFHVELLDGFGGSFEKNDTLHGLILLVLQSQRAKVVDIDSELAPFSSWFLKIGFRTRSRSTNHPNHEICYDMNVDPSRRWRWRESERESRSISEICVHINAHIYTYIYTYIYAYIYAYINTYMYYIYTYIHI